MRRKRFKSVAGNREQREREKNVKKEREKKEFI